MKLTIVERLLVMDMLPKQGDFAALKEFRRAKEALSFTNDELMECEIKIEGGRVSWGDAGNDYVKDLPLSEWITSQIQDDLRKKNTEKKLEDTHFSLYEKFIVAYDQV